MASPFPFSPKGLVTSSGTSTTFCSVWRGSFARLIRLRISPSGNETGTWSQSVVSRNTPGAANRSSPKEILTAPCGSWAMIRKRGRAMVSAPTFCCRSFACNSAGSPSRIGCNGRRRVSPLDAACRWAGVEAGEPGDGVTDFDQALGVVVVGEAAAGCGGWEGGSSRNHRKAAFSRPVILTFAPEPSVLMARLPMGAPAARIGARKNPTFGGPTVAI